jgi:hypothetical protein
VTGRTGSKAAVPCAISARYLCLQSEDARSPVASRPGAQGRPRPEHRKRRGSSAAPGRGNRYGEQRTVRGRGRQPGSPCPCTRSAVSAGRSRGDMSTPQKHPPTRHYLQTTSDNRRYGRVGGQGRPAATRPEGSLRAHGGVGTQLVGARVKAAAIAADRAAGDQIIRSRRTPAPRQGSR